jgi:hypothetical protein
MSGFSEKDNAVADVVRNVRGSHEDHSDFHTEKAPAAEVDSSPSPVPSGHGSRQESIREAEVAKPSEILPSDDDEKKKDGGLGHFFVCSKDQSVSCCHRAEGTTLSDVIQTAHFPIYRSVGSYSLPHRRYLLRRYRRFASSDDIDLRTIHNSVHRLRRRCGDSRPIHRSSQPASPLFCVSGCCTFRNHLYRHLFRQRRSHQNRPSTARSVSRAHIATGSMPF